MSRTVWSSPRAIGFTAFVFCCVFLSGHWARAADLQTGANGAASSPASPVLWVANPVTIADAHFQQGNSIPFRLVLNGITPGFHSLEIEWDTKHGGAHAIDFLTSFQRLAPHDAYAGHNTTESVSPVLGLSGSYFGPVNFALPAPGTLDSPVAGEPAATFGSLPAAEKFISIWNGVITNVSFVAQAGLASPDATTRLLIQFEAITTNVIIAWGGHIASSATWGTNAVGAGTTGQPYVVRAISLNSGPLTTNTLGGASGTAVVAPFSVTITGPDSVCAGTTNTYSLAGLPPGISPTFAWSLPANTAGAFIAGEVTNASVEVVALTSGSYQLALLADNGLVQTDATHTVTVLIPTEASPLTSQAVCPGATVVYSTAASGESPLSFVWRKAGEILAGETGDTLTLTNVGPADVAEYCVEVSGACGTVTRCATLSLIPAPAFSAPTNLAVQCFGEVPEADTNVVVATGAVAVFHLGDLTEINGCEITVTRTYAAVSSCNVTSTLAQVITVRDTVPPVLDCSTNIVVACTGGGATVNFEVSATDSCSGLGLVYSVPPSGTTFAVGTNLVTSVAVDACGNTNACNFTVTVLDLEPPTFDCPADIIAAEFPRDSGFAVVTFVPPLAQDNCDANPTVYFSPASGSSFPVGITPVTCAVVDSFGNTNSCTFTVRVIPYRLIVTTNVTTTADSGPGSLRQALLDANAAPGENLVQFNITSPGPHVIALESPLPEITSPVIIDGWSQPGFAGVPIITLTGVNLTNAADGLVLLTGDSTVQGLVLNGFATGIKILGPGNNVIQGNFIGTDAAGLVAVPNAGDGIYVASGHNLIGGTTNLSPNVISGNGGNGILIDGPGATNNAVRGNYIGLGADFSSPLGNGAAGVRLGNGASRNSIGGAVPNSANGIANNLGPGVGLLPTAGTGNGITGNAIFLNGGLGIDLNEDGVTPNDAGDADTGANEGQNYPILTDARMTNGNLVVEGSYTGLGNASYRLDFYLNNTADPSGSGEGFLHLGQRLLEVSGSGTENFSYAFPVTAVYTQLVTATATDLGDNTSEFSPAFTVRTPPVIELQPASTNTTPGGTVVLCASASGTTPIYYQWRLNGANIPDATNACLEILSVDYTNGGSYTVVIYNDLGAGLTEKAGVGVTVPHPVIAADNFADALPLEGLSGETAWSNEGATRELGEPLHAGKPGNHSVWYKWTAPEKGILTIGLRGSDFDTLLGAYRGTNVAYLYTEGADEDRGGYYTSGLRINVFKERTYYFAVDGFGGESGHFFFGWSHEFTPHMLPAILQQPKSQTVALGSNATFTVVAARVCGNGVTNCTNLDHYGSEEDPHPSELPNLDCQWLLNGMPIPGATAFTLAISNVQPANLGLYRARIITPWQVIESEDADLEINLTGDTTQSVRAADKLADALLLPAWIIGDLLPPTTPPEGTVSRDTVVRGYTGTQIFNTTGSGTGSADEPICGVLGGASEYITFVAAENGILFLNTDGSSYDTVMAVFVRNPTNATQLIYLACDNNHGADGLDSALSIPVTAGQTNVVLVDGVNGASGILQLNYSLLSSITLLSLGNTADGNAYQMQVVSRTNAHFNIQRSSNMLQWTSIITTNSPSGVFNYADPKPPGSVRFFYRAQLIP